jgi:rubrerythrin
MCHIFYEMGHNGILICAEIEFFPPAQVYLDNQPILGQPKKKIEPFFISKFEDYEYENNRSDKYEIGFYAPVCPGDRSIVKSVAIARKGYSRQQKEFYDKAYAQNSQKEIIKEYECIKCKYIKASDSPFNLCPACNLMMLPR